MDEVQRVKMEIEDWVKANYPELSSYLGYKIILRYYDPDEDDLELACEKASVEMIRDIQDLYKLAGLACPVKREVKLEMEDVVAGVF